MKKLKNVWLFLSFILMVAGMASCSTDDDPTGVEVSKEDIIGNWQVTANDWTNSEEESNRNDHVGQTLSVKNDGTASFRGESFSWTLSKGADAVGQPWPQHTGSNSVVYGGGDSSFVRLYL